MASDLLHSFVEAYTRETAFYAKVASFAEERCRKTLGENGIPAIVTSRAKRPDRLLEKLKQRHAEKAYATTQEIYDDLFDLAGVRVALYFPGQEYQVVRLIQKAFEIVKIKPMGDSRIQPVDNSKAKISSVEKSVGDLAPGNTLNVVNNLVAQSADDEEEVMPYRDQFPGYRAVHARVKLGTTSLPEDQTPYGTTLIEIQIASLLMHAWSEVNHDLAYKTLNGELSVDELRMLDGINGLVRTGEVLLNQLKASVDARIATQNRPFANMFELGAFVQSYAPYDPSDNKYRLGSLSSLLQVLRHLGIDKPTVLGTHLQEWAKDASNLKRYPLTNSILDHLLAKKPDGPNQAIPFKTPQREAIREV